MPIRMDGKDELQYRRSLTVHMRSLIMKSLQIEYSDENVIMGFYRGFYLQFGFSEAHPLLVFHMVRKLEGERENPIRRINSINLTGVLGCHIYNEELKCYTFRATHWIDTEMSQERFFEILDRCVDEAVRAYNQLTSHRYEKNE